MDFISSTVWPPCGAPWPAVGKSIGTAVGRKEGSTTASCLPTLILDQGSKFTDKETEAQRQS